MSDTPEIAAIREIWTPDDAPHGAHILDTAPWNTTVEMAQSHIATLLAALDEAQAQMARLTALQRMVERIVTETYSGETDALLLMSKGKATNRLIIYYDMWERERRRTDGDD